MPNLKRLQKKMVCRGVNLSKPGDLLQDGEYTILNNVRVLQQGGITSRPGYTKVTNPALGEPFVRTIRRLNRTIPGETPLSSLIVGAGSSIYVGMTSFVQADTGYFGFPMSMLPMQPEQSPEAWMYIYDVNKNRKINVNGTVKTVGIAPPLNPPNTEVGQPNYTLVNDFDATAGWTNQGIAGAPSLVSRVPAATTISIIVYDSGTTGYANVVPVDATTNYSWLRPGARLTFNAAETVVVEEVHNPIDNTTVQSVMYDVGTTGLCSVVLSAPTPGLRRNSLVTINGVTTVRVLSISIGPDGLYSFRCNTGASTISAGQTVAGLTSLRAFFAGTFSAGQAITTSALQFTLTTTDGGTGSISLASVLNLATAGGRPIQTDDYMHISLRVDNPLNITKGRILLDCDATTNDFTRNYFYKEFRQNDLTPNAQGTLSSFTARQAAIQKDIVDNTDLGYRNQDIYSNDYTGSYTDYSYQDAPYADQLNIGSAQWTELLFRISDLVRAGADSTRTLKDIKAIRVEFTVTATTIVEADSWWVGGTYGPDVLPGSPAGIFYRYRYRDSTTGARSLPGPATRHDLYPTRQKIEIPLEASLNTAVDSIDIERLGGGLNRWTYIGTLANTNGTFTDELVAQLVSANPALETNVIQPWPSLDKPRTGRATVSGTSIQWVSGDVFNMAWLPGTIIRLNGVAYQMYGQPSSTTRMQIVESAGTDTNVLFQIDSPIIMGQQLPYAFGPLEGTTAVFAFGIGDLYNPGRIYWTNGNDPDSSASVNYVDASSPSEPLVSGCVYNSVVFTGTRDRIMTLRPSFDGINQFTVVQVSSPSGVWGTWAMCAGPDGVYLLGRDGIYKGSEYGFTCITNGDLYPLFPHDGQPVGIAANNYQPIDMTRNLDLRLSYADSSIYFDYVDTNGNRCTWRYSIATQGWFFENYANPVMTHYQEESVQFQPTRLLMGSDDGFVLDSNATDDAGQAIGCRVRTSYLDGGDDRSTKLWMDYMMDYQGSNIQAEIGYNNFVVPGAINILPTLGDRGQSPIPISTPTALAIYRNFGVEFQFTYGPTLYAFEPSFYDQAIVTKNYVTQLGSSMDGAVIPGWKQLRYHRYALISTGGVTFTIRNDDGVILDTFTVPSTGGVLKVDFNNIQHASKGRLLSYNVAADTEFALFPDETFVRIKKWGGAKFAELRPFV